ncbi:hypothetical protein D9613_009372 [Agrocybe pediades]|uniref:F-box domain-containing protein n=1 Tax=Agrocybe pediades TaxID=84607 RepID=A0A8H4VTV9_9AGAR|nr:hypothetical protein D9613_009372 [Agrocybe pediades]
MSMGNTQAGFSLYSTLPISRLPLEIMVEIFQLVCPPPDRSATKMSSHTPLFLGTICRQWRDMAWSAAILWKDVALHLGASSLQVALLQEWLLRAKSMPLNITLYRHRLNALVSHETLAHRGLDKAVFKVLLTRSCYWSSFHCDGLLPEFVDIFQDSRFPILKSIHLAGYRPLRSRHTYSFPPPNTLLAASPLLEHLILEGYSLSKTVMPLAPLRSFTICYHSIDECITVFQTYPNLVSADLRNIFPRHPATGFASWTPTFTISHKTLSSLRVHTRLNTERLLQHLELPALNHLHVNAEITCLGSIVHLIQRSRCSLNTFDLWAEYTGDEDLVGAFRTFPRLSMLRWAWSWILMFDIHGQAAQSKLKPDVVNMLNPTYSNGQPLLPNLTSLIWADYIPEDCQIPLAEAIEQRWRVQEDTLRGSPGVARLKSVKFFEKCCNSELKKLLSKLSLEGMEVELMVGEITLAAFNALLTFLNSDKIVMSSTELSLHQKSIYLILVCVSQRRQLNIQTSIVIRPPHSPRDHHSRLGLGC